MFYQINQRSQYPEDLVAPMAQELTDAGYKSLRTPEEVASILDSTEGTTLVVVNSVCGCAARNARPAAVMATHEGKQPTNLVTVFAGVFVTTGFKVAVADFIAGLGAVLTGVLASVLVADLAIVFTDALLEVTICHPYKLMV